MTRTNVKHPAKFSKAIMDLLCFLIREEADRSKFSLNVLDPFAGVGSIHEISKIDPRIKTMGVEIEAEWAMMGPACNYCEGSGQNVNAFDGDECPACGGTGTKTIVGNALHLPDTWTNSYHVVATSPTYGNRMADHHDAKDGSKRMTYTHVLGHELHPDNSGKLHFGPAYKEFHEKAWAEVTRVIKRPVWSVGPSQVRTLDYPGGLFILNVSDFIRSGQPVPVCDWHCETILSLGYDLELEENIPTPRLRYGQNHSARVTHEKVFAFRRTMRR